MFERKITILTTTQRIASFAMFFFIIRLLIFCEPHEQPPLFLACGISRIQTPTYVKTTDFSDSLVVTVVDWVTKCEWGQIRIHSSSVVVSLAFGFTPFPLGLIGSPIGPHRLCVGRRASLAPNNVPGTFFYGGKNTHRGSAPVSDS